MTIQAMGVLRSRHQAPLSAQVGGMVLKKYHEIGDVIAAGEAILALDPEPFELALQQAQGAYASAQAAFEQASRNLQRYQKLNDDGDVSQFEFENTSLGEQSTRAALQMAESALKMAERNLRLSKLTSPVKGRLAQLNAQIGEQVAPGQPLATVVDLEQMEIEVGLSEQEVPRLSCGQEARVFVSAYSGQTFTGKVRSVGVAGLDAGKTFPVIITVDNASGLLRPGMAAVADILYAAHQNVLYISREALVAINTDEPTIFVVEGNRAVRRRVSLGDGDGRQVIVETGLQSGDKLVIEGQNVLRDSIKIKIL
jgi:RND family efflux transporter MFP subunit